MLSQTGLDVIQPCKVDPICTRETKHAVSNAVLQTSYPTSLRTENPASSIIHACALTADLLTRA